jgi:hypothetical protein
MPTKKTDDSVDPGYEPQTQIGVSCVWCKKATFFERPDEAPPEGLQFQVECENCGKTTPVPDVVFNPPAGDSADVEER